MRVINGFTLHSLHFKSERLSANLYGLQQKCGVADSKILIFFSMTRQEGLLGHMRRRRRRRRRKAIDKTRNSVNSFALLF